MRSRNAKRRNKLIEKIWNKDGTRKWLSWAKSAYFTWSKHHLMRHGVIWDSLAIWHDRCGQRLRYHPEPSDTPDSLFLAFCDHINNRVYRFGARFTYDRIAMEWGHSSHASLDLPIRPFHVHLRREQFIALSLCLRRRPLGFALLAIKPFCC